MLITATVNHEGRYKHPQGTTKEWRGDRLVISQCLYRLDDQTILVTNDHGARFVELHAMLLGFDEVTITS